jgi:hypothetical protein
MSIVRDNGDERRVRVDRLVDELRKAQSRRLANAATVKDSDQGVKPQPNSRPRTSVAAAPATRIPPE